jgi:DNA mismatch repair ATPase MutL
MATLSKPYAVIRRALALAPEGAAGEVEGDAEDEEDLEDDLLAMDARPPTNDKGKGKGKQRAEEEEEEPPLFPDIIQTPPRNSNDPTSSPSSIYPSSAIKDYSSELDFSSPPMSDTSKRDLEEDSDDEDEEEEERKRKKAKRASGRKERTRRYEVVGIVRKKVVFALRYVSTRCVMSWIKADIRRPEPIVTATILPE